MLTDDARNPRQIPTKGNIVSCHLSPPGLRLMYCPVIFRLMRCNGSCGVRSRMTRFSSIVRRHLAVAALGIDKLNCGTDSGHGGQTKDQDGDEADGYDEGRQKYFFC